MFTGVLPSKFQRQDYVVFFGEQAQVLSVHFYNTQVKYDIEVLIQDSSLKTESHRLYNVPEALLALRDSPDAPLYKKLV